MLTFPFFSELDAIFAGVNIPADLSIFVNALKEAVLVDDVLTIECRSDIYCMVIQIILLHRGVVLANRQKIL